MEIPASYECISSDVGLCSRAGFLSLTLCFTIGTTLPCAARGPERVSIDRRRGRSPGPSHYISPRPGIRIGLYARVYLAGRDREHIRRISQNPPVPAATGGRRLAGDYRASPDRAAQNTLSLPPKTLFLPSQSSQLSSVVSYRADLCHRLDTLRRPDPGAYSCAGI